MYPIFAPDEIFKEIERSFDAYLWKSGFYKVVRCLTIMQEITDIDEAKQGRTDNLN